jgi:hypothetical protein
VNVRAWLCERSLSGQLADEIGRVEVLTFGLDRVASFERSQRRDPAGADIAEAHGEVDVVIIPGSHVGPQHIKRAHGSKLSGHCGRVQRRGLAGAAGGMYR